MSDLWKLVWGKPEVDPAALATAIERAVEGADLDFRTRLLIRDGTAALESHWGHKRLTTWLQGSPVRNKIEAIRNEDLGAPGFPFVKDRIMDRTDPETVRQFLRELGMHLHHPVPLPIGGSIPLILAGYLARATEDIDVVNEVPVALRAHRGLLEQLAKRYGLHLTHFQSHFLPAGWESRLHSLGSYGTLQVFTVDVYDIFLSKLFSNREKDRDDLRVLSPQLNRETIVRRLHDSAGSLLQEPLLRPNAERNWYILYGDSLPPAAEGAG